MEKEFVPYELAVKLKALGFDEDCFMYWYKANNGYVLVNEINQSFQQYILAPTFSQSFRWFREKHDIVSYIQRFEGNTFDYECNSPKFKEVIDFEDGPFDTYEEAERACLERLIDKITNKKIFDFVTDL